MNTASALRTWRMRNIGYDANNRDNPWYDITADHFLEAVAMCLDCDCVSFTQPIAPMSSIHAAYIRSSTGGYTKIGCVQVGQ